MCFRNLNPEELKTTKPSFRGSPLEPSQTSFKEHEISGQAGTTPSQVLNRMPFHQLAVLAGSKSGNPAFAKELQARKQLRVHMVSGLGAAD